MKLLSVIGLILWVCVGWTSDKKLSHRINNELDVEYSRSSQRNHLLFSVGYSQFSLEGNSLDGLDFEAMSSQSFSSSWAFGAGASLGSSLSETSSLYAKVFFQGNYSLLGNLESRQEELKLSGTPVVAISTVNTRLLYLYLSANQYFLTGSTSTVAFSGPGFGLVYIPPRSSKQSIFYSLGMDSLANSLATATSFKLSVGYRF